MKKFTINRINFYLFIIFTTFLQTLHADDSTITLQNGLNGYDGCEDSYIKKQVIPDHTDTLDTAVTTVNHNGENVIEIYNCPS